MTPLFTAGFRTRLVAAAMAAVIPMLVFAQTDAPAVKSERAAPKPAITDSSSTGVKNDAGKSTTVQTSPPATPAVANSNPTGVENGTDKSMAVQTSPPPTRALPPTVEFEIQSRFNELRREILDDRADSIEWWLAVVAIVLTFFSIVIPIGAYITVAFSFKRFEEIKAEAQRYVEDIRSHRDEAEKGAEAIRRLNAEQAAAAPEQAKEAAANIRENPKASLLDKAIAHAISLQQQGKRNDAIEKWRAVAAVAEESDNDQAARAWFSVGYLSQDVDPQAGILAYDHAIRLKPDFAAAYVNRGNTKGTIGRHEDALADYNEAIRINPQDAKGYYNRGTDKVRLGRYEDALADFDEAIRINPHYAAAYVNRGNTKGTLGRHEGALADYNEAIRINPQDAKGYYNRGDAKGALGRHEDALTDFDEAIRINPHYAVAYTNRGYAKGALGRHEDALTDFDEAIRINPHDAVAYFNRGYAKGELGRHEDALADFDEAIRINPHYAVAYYNRGIAKGELGRHEDALADFDEAIRLKPNYAESYYNRGNANKEIGEYEKTRADFQRALELATEQGNQELAQKAQDFLDELPPPAGVN